MRYPQDATGHPYKIEDGKKTYVDGFKPQQEAKQAEAPKQEAKHFKK